MSFCEALKLITFRVSSATNIVANCGELQLQLTGQKKMPKLILFKIIKMRQILSKFSVWEWDLIIRFFVWIVLSHCKRKILLRWKHILCALSLWQTIIFTPFGNSDSRTKFCLAQILIQNGQKNQIPNVSNFKQNFIAQICSNSKFVCKIWIFNLF